MSKRNDSLVFRGALAVTSILVACALALGLSGCQTVPQWKEACAKSEEDTELLVGCMQYPACKIDYEDYTRLARAYAECHGEK